MSDDKDASSRGHEAGEVTEPKRAIREISEHKYGSARKGWVQTFVTK
jgi:hypothetical protein